MQQPILTISILISNRPETVERCLSSVRPLMEKVPSELILTDTGCGQKVRGIIERYTKHIIDFPWRKDFSAARNAGLAEAKGQWFLYLDDDEWFEDTEGIARFFLSGESKRYKVAYYTQRNYMRPEGAPGSEKTFLDHHVDRVLRITPDLHFEHRVHEAYTYNGKDIGIKKDLGCFVHHYGYAYRSEEEKRSKYLRNRELLELEVKEHPKDMRMRYQMSIAPFTLQLWDDAIAIAEEGIRIKSNSAYWDALHTNLLYCLQKQGKWEEIAERGQAYTKKRLYPYDLFGVYQYLIQAYWNLRRYPELLDAAKEALRLYRAYRKDPASFDEGQLLRDDFWQKDAIAAMFLMITAAAKKESSEETERLLGQKEFSDVVTSLREDAVYRFTLEAMIGEDGGDGGAVYLRPQSGAGNGAKPAAVLGAENSASLTAALQEMLAFPAGFFEAEDADGAEGGVKPMTKCARALELEVLRRFDALCRAYGIPYFLAGTTLLGAARCQGFAGADCISVCMFRNDWYRVADLIEEACPGLFAADIYNSPSYGMQAGRIVCGRGVRTARDDLKDAYGFPFPAGLDVFPLDVVPDDEEERREYFLAQQNCRLAVLLYQKIKQEDPAADGYFGKVRALRAAIAEAGKSSGVTFDQEIPPLRELLILLDEVQGAYRDGTGRGLVCTTAASTEKDVVPAAYYESAKELPFEMLKIPAPAGYDALLKKEYGDTYGTAAQSGLPDGGREPSYKKMYERLFGVEGSKDFAENVRRMERATAGFYTKFLQRSSRPVLTYTKEELRADAKDAASEEAAIRAAESEVIEEIKRICAIYGFSLYATGEDEPHLLMPRKDFREFLARLPEELDPWFDHRDLLHTPEHADLRAYIITDAYRTREGEYEQRFHGCAHIVGVDIAPIDRLSENEAKEKLRETMFAEMIASEENAPECVRAADLIAALQEEEKSSRFRVFAFPEDARLRRFSEDDLAKTREFFYGKSAVRVPLFLLPQ